MSEIAELARRLEAFADERNWDQYHSPKNLVMALMVETGELMEHFQWRTAEQCNALDSKDREEIRLELADVFIYLVRLADKLGVDLAQAAREKIVLNAEKYPPGVRPPNLS